MCVLFTCDIKMLRYTVLSVLLVACHVRAQTTDVDDSTVEWVKKQYPANNQNNKDNLNLQLSNRGKDLTESEVNAALNWVKDIIPSHLQPRFNNSEQTVNLNPSNIEIKNSSFSRPGQPANQNSDENNSTPYPETPCTSEEGFSGVCVLYYLCDVNTRKVIGDGTHLIDVRFGSNSTGRNCPHYLDVCCQLKDRVTPPQAVGPMVGSYQPQIQHLVGSYSSQKFDEDLMRVSDPVTDDFTVKPKLQQQCGWNRPEQFIFRPPNQEVADSGVYANYGEFPWMVALMRKSGTKVWVQDDYIGGGSLIHPSVVMTAKHKLLKVTAAQLKCRAGEWDTQTDKEQYEIQERDADRFVSHPDFYMTSLYYDVALIFLKQPFELAGAPHIGTACLAPMLPDPDRATCFGMGWGKGVDFKEHVHILKKVRLSLVEHKSCQEMLHKNTRFRLNPYFRLHESFTCAGGEQNVDTCEGDGGSPLVCRIGRSNGRTRYAVVGIVAYGLGCGQKDVPGVYVNVPHVYTWVQQQMADNNYTSDTFTY